MKKKFNKGIILTCIMHIGLIGFIFILIMLGKSSLPDIIDPDDFIKYLESEGCKVQTITNDTDISKMLLHLETDNETCPYIVSYTIYETSKDSQAIFYQHYPFNMKNNSSYYRTYFTFDIGNKSFFKEVITSDIYEGRVINNNSALAFAAPKEYTKDMNEMLEYFNYIFDYEKYFSLSISWFLLIFSISLIISMWLIFKKLGEKGWKSIIPIYNLWCLSRLTLGSPWYSLFIFIPFFNVIMILTLFYCLGRRFERKRLYCVALMFFPTVVLPLLAFSFKDEEVNNN